MAKHTSSTSSVCLWTGRLRDEHDIHSTWCEVSDNTVCPCRCHVYLLCCSVCKLIPRWTRPGRRVSSWRSAMSSLTSFRRGGSSLAARSRKGRWGQIIYVCSILFFKWLPAFCCQKLCLPQSLICIRPFGRPRIPMVSCFSVTKIDPISVGMSFFLFSGFVPLLYLHFTPIWPASNQLQVLPTWAWSCLKFLPSKRKIFLGTVAWNCLLVGI